EACAAHGHAVLDFPAILAGYMKGELPNRRIFLDYCHLTTEGMSLAMAHVASKTAASLTGRNISADNLHSRSAPPVAEIEGKASFLAAVHNAHFYQPHGIVHYWCSRALQFWPECSELMKKIVDLQTRRTPMIANKAALEFACVDRMGILDYVLRGDKQRIDLTLVDAIVKSLAALGVDVRNETGELRRQERSVRTARIDLTDFYYASAVPNYYN